MGRVWKFGDNIDTDVIIPSQYVTTYDRDTIAEHAMEPVSPEFGEETSAGDIVVAGRNFGCGSSREAAAWAFTENGIEGIIASSFARIFFRNAINNGLPVYISPEGAERIDETDDVEIIYGDEIEIRNHTKDETYYPEQHPEFVQKILDAGGLGPYRSGMAD